jgi:hypothetical protein
MITTAMQHQDGTTRFVGIGLGINTEKLDALGFQCDRIAIDDAVDDFRCKALLSLEIRRGSGWYSKYEKKTS